MAEPFVDSEEEWSEADLFDEAANGQHPSRRSRDGTSDPRQEPSSGVSPVPERHLAASGPFIKLSVPHVQALTPSYIEEGSSEASRSPLELPRSNPPSPGVQAGHKRGCAFGTPETTPRAEKAVQEFSQPMASCPVAIAHFGKKQHMAEQPALDQLPSPLEHPFMPPHELLAQTLPEYDADVARLGFRPGSVMEGAGRKLQGRDAVQFRQAIMRQTGFLENDDRLGQSVPG